MQHHARCCDIAVVHGMQFLASFPSAALTADPEEHSAVLCRSTLQTTTTCLDTNRHVRRGSKGYDCCFRFRYRLMAMTTVCTAVRDKTTGTELSWLHSETGGARNIQMRRCCCIVTDGALVVGGWADSWRPNVLTPATPQNRFIFEYHALLPRILCSTLLTEIVL